MKQLFLTSSVNFVAQDIASKIDQTKYKKLAFITTASEAEEGDKQWEREDKDALVKAGFAVFDYTLTNKKLKDVERDLQSADVIYCSGGNTFYLLEKVQQSGFAPLLREYVQQGKIYMSTSAGSQIAGPDILPLRRAFGDELEKAPDLKDYKGIGLVDFVVFPHWGSDQFKKRYDHRMKINYNTDNKIVILTDYQYVYVKDDWYQIVDVK